MRVLVADDTALFREGLVRLLEEAGHDVTAVADAEALVAACLTNAPDVAVVDVRMPPTMTDDGARAVQQLRSADPHLPVVLLLRHPVRPRDAQVRFTMEGREFRLVVVFQLGGLAAHRARHIPVLRHLRLARVQIGRAHV